MKKTEKNLYITPEVEVIKFSTNDVISTSFVEDNGSDTEGPWIPAQ